MPSTSSGRIAKSRRQQKTTPHQKNHRWGSFSAKISKLHSLDPLRRVRRHDLDDEDLSTTTSYLRNSAEKWSDLNISKSFSTFRRELLPLCGSLPQILHFEDKIMDLLASYISMQEKEALESLLDLLTAFAHDLGVRFEKHYLRALQLLVGIASQPQDVEVIEWTFAALAFLFKYLSRLLVSDLRPTYDALAPLLGKAKQPGHIARFTGEALSFLVKKAAAPGNREKALPLIIEHTRDDLISTLGSRQFELYYHGVMTLFAEAVKSSGNTVHSTGSDILRVLICSIPMSEFAPGGPGTWQDVCCGILISIVHHSTPETFRPIADELIREATTESNIREATTEAKGYVTRQLRLQFFVRLLGIVSGVRKGSRIEDWSSLVEALKGLLDAVTMGEFLLSDWKDMTVNVAIIWSQASMESLIPYLSKLIHVMTEEPLQEWFIPFCTYLEALDRERFCSLFRKPFQRFIATHWSDDDNEDLLCVLLPRMVATGAFPPSGGKDSCQLPQAWQNDIVANFDKLEFTPFPERGAINTDLRTWRDRGLPKYAALLRVLESTSVHPSTNSRIAELLLTKLKLALRPSITATEESLFIVNDGFRAYLRLSRAVKSMDTTLSPLLRAAAPRFCHLTGFLESLLAYEREVARDGTGESYSNNGSDTSQEEENALVNSLIAHLATPSHQHRLVSLHLLQTLGEGLGQDRFVLESMLHTEQMPFDLQNSRSIVIYFRKLGQSYSSLPEASWLRKAVPSFLFGMLTVPVSPLWDEAVNTLARISEDKFGEEAVANLAFEWLDVPSARWAGNQKAPATTPRRLLTDFECLNLTKVRELAHDALPEDPPFKTLRKTFQQTQEVIVTFSTQARTRALKVLSSLPALAEKRSRRLVPHLLSWTSDQHEQIEDQDEDQSSQEIGTWSQSDKKALVGVFSHFNNPKVLYQHENVYDALLGLVANGDIEIQRLALKAILAWKQPGVKPYKEDLESLLEDSKFKNELTLILQNDQKIQPVHRQELMPVLLRLLYGRTISRKGAASGRHGLHATRLSVIRNLSVEDTGAFLKIALGRFQDIRVVDDSELCESVVTRDIIPARTQVGLLNMLDSIVNELGTSVDPYADDLAHAVMYCLISACRKLRDSAVGLVSDTEAPEEKSDTSLRKVVRTTSLKSLVTLFKNAESFDWKPYIQILVSEVVTPSLEKLPLETTQGISWILRLLSTWSTLPRCALFLTLDERALPKIIECLSIAKAKDDVKIFALRIVRNLIQFGVVDGSGQSDLNADIKAMLLDPNVDEILSRIDGALRSSGDVGRDLLEACVETVVELSPIVEKSTNIRSLVDISTFLLKQPSRRVNPKVKGSLLLILERFITLDDLHSDTTLKQGIYTTLSSMFSFFKDQQNRQTLSRVLLVFASQDPSVQVVADLCADLNSYVEDRLDEPDHDRRFSAFKAISQPREVPFTSQQWTPLLQNLVYFIRQDEEYGFLSNNSADGLCKFVEAAASTRSGATEESFTSLLASIVLPAIYSGAREQSETVRRNILRVFGFLVEKLGSWAPVADLASLVSDTDDSDRAFFTNILRSAVAGRIQALQLLECANAKSEFSGRNISQFFIPLLEHFIFGREEGTDDHGLGAQATNTIANLTASLEWTQYRAVLRRFLSFAESRPDLQKQVIRLLDKVIDSLAISSAQSVAGGLEASLTNGSSRKFRLSGTLPEPQKLVDEVTQNLLPPLLKQLHHKDESTVSARVPVGIIIVKLLNILPTQERDQKLPGVLTDICHILRSKAWESREMARDTLAQISRILGPSCFGFVLTELRGALARGSQLHILSYTVHSLLLAVIPVFKQGDLDYCLDAIVAIIMDDIFGAAGQEKDAEEYVSKMKEVKSSKSQDSMELIAKNASVNHLIDLIHPLRSFLLEKLDIKMARKIDDLLSRITNGLLQNPAAESRDTLVFCYEVIQDTYKNQEPQAQPQIDRKLRKYLLQRGPKKDKAGATKFTHKLVRFAIEVLRSILRKHDRLRTASNIAGFLPMLGDAVVGADEEVKTAAFKLLAVIAKVPFKTSESSDLYKVAVKEAVKAIATSSTTSTDAAQSAMKLISVVLRDRRDITVRDAAVDVLLGKLKDDLTEPLYRHVTFNFLRSILDRKIETAVVYDTLDYVGTVMVTNPDKDTRDLARGAFFQFLRDYPQKKSRWQKQLSFIVANLKYEGEGGRISVMEVVHLLLLKSADDFVQEVVSTCFIPLVFSLANDDSEKCRLAAGELVKEMFKRASRENARNFLKLLRSWTEQDDKPAVLKLALQVFGLYFEGVEGDVKDKKDIKMIINRVAGLLRNHGGDWEVVATALTTTQCLLNYAPSILLAPDAKDLWDQVQQCLFLRDASVRLAAVKLLGMYLADFAGNHQTGQQARLGSHGLHLEKTEVARLLKGCLHLLYADEVEEVLGTEAAQILVFLGSLVEPISATENEDAEAESEKDEQDDDNADVDLQYLLHRLAGIVRRETRPKASFLVPKVAALDVLAVFSNNYPKEHIEPSVRAILRPLRNLTDPSIPAPYVLDEVFKTRYAAMKAKAQEIMEALQKKFGTGEYSRLLLGVGQGIKGRREHRSTKRKIEAITQPEKHGREKRKKYDVKKERRKTKGQQYRSLRRGY